MADPIVPVVAQPQTPPQLPPQVPPAGPAPQQPAPAPQPVQQPAPVEQEQDTDNIEETGNAVLDATISAFVSVTGAKPSDLNRAVSKALEYQDANLIDVAFIKERFGKHAAQAISIAKAAVAENISQAGKASDAAKQVAYSVAGDQAKWNQAVSVFNTAAPANIKAAVEALMDKGNIKAGAELLMQTVSQSGLVPETNPSLNGGSVTAGNTGALSAQQFKTELATLRKEAGNGSLETGPNAEKYNRLITRRRAGKQAGI